MKTTLNPFENAKRTAQGTGGISPSVIEEIQAEISVLGSQNETQAQDITDIKGSLNSINDNLTEKVTKFSGTDSGNTYVTVDGLAYDETNKKLGLKVNGADTVIPFSSKAVLLWTNGNPSNSFAGQTLNIANLSDYDTIIICTRYRADRRNVGYEFFPTNVLSGYSLYSLLCIDTTYRTVARSGNQLTFSDTQKGGGTDNTYNIPLEIYGLKNDILD